MKEITFAHFSDTHLIAEESSNFVKSLAITAEDPWIVFETALKQAAAEKPQFVLMTGDIVHEGTEKEYCAVRELFERYLPGVPVFPAAGNHDRRRAMCRGLEGWDSTEEEPFVRSGRIGGLRVVALDTAFMLPMEGSLPEEQLETFYNILREPAPCGTLLIMHHPICTQRAQSAMAMPKRLENCLEMGEIRGIFTGHLHHGEQGEILGIPHFISNSLAFGIEGEKDGARYTDHCAWQLCRLKEDGSFSVTVKEVRPETKTLQRKPYAVKDAGNVKNAE